MKVRDLMTPHPTCAEPETTVEEIATWMKQEDIGCVPVVEEGQVVGMITDRDIVTRCIAEGKDPAECRAEDINSPQSVTIGPDADAKEAARLMADRQIRRLAVVEGGKLVGMLSLGDVAVKEQNDRLSGDVLQDVSEGVKGSGATTMHPHMGGSRSSVKTSTADRTEAGRSSTGHTTGSQQNFARQKQTSGLTPEEHIEDRRHDRGAEDARPSAAFEPVPSGITNRGPEEAARQEKVLPFREKRDNRVRSEANRTRDEAERRSRKPA